MSTVFNKKKKTTRPNNFNTIGIMNIFYGRLGCLKSYNKYIHIHLYIYIYIYIYISFNKRLSQGAIDAGGLAPWGAARPSATVVFNT